MSAAATLPFFYFRASSRATSGCALCDGLTGFIPDPHETRAFANQRPKSLNESFSINVHRSVNNSVSILSEDSGFVLTGVAMRQGTDHVPSKTRRTTENNGSIRTVLPKVSRLIRNATHAAERVFVEVKTSWP